MPVGPIPRHAVEQWSAASCPGQAAAHCCAGAALPPSTQVGTGIPTLCGGPYRGTAPHASGKQINVLCLVGPRAALQVACRYKQLTASPSAMDPAATGRTPRSGNLRHTLLGVPHIGLPSKALYPRGAAPGISWPHPVPSITPSGRADSRSCTDTRDIPPGAPTRRPLCSPHLRHRKRTFLPGRHGSLGPPAGSDEKKMDEARPRPVCARSCVRLPPAKS
jgi:hypothetical protein